MDSSIAFIMNFELAAWHLRFILASLLILILLGGVIFTKAENIALRSAVYFALQNALTVGYGDVVAKTRWGRIASLVIGFLDLIFFGLIVAKATYALHSTMNLSKPS